MLNLNNSKLLTKKSIIQLKDLIEHYGGISKNTLQVKEP